VRLRHWEIGSVSESARHGGAHRACERLCETNSKMRVGHKYCVTSGPPQVDHCQATSGPLSQDLVGLGEAFGVADGVDARREDEEHALDSSAQGLFVDFP
jgi:hypothetical protein